MSFELLELTPENIKKYRRELIESRKKDNGTAILDFFELQGSFALENAAELAENLQINEILEVIPEKASDGRIVPHKAVRRNGETAGFLPYSKILLPQALAESGKRIYCTVEYIDFSNGILTVCAALYCEKF